MNHLGKVSVLASLLMVGCFQWGAPERPTIYRDMATALENAESATHVNLWKKGLTAFPEGLERLPALKLLSLQENDLKTVPATVGKLVGLESLNLRETGLTVVPDGVGELGVAILALRRV